MSMGTRAIKPSRVGSMTYFELMEKSIQCAHKALEYYAKKEFDLAKFYKGASVTYKNRALNLIIEEQ